MQSFLNAPTDTSESTTEGDVNRLRHCESRFSGYVERRATEESSVRGAGVGLAFLLRPLIQLPTAASNRSTYPLVLFRGKENDPDQETKEAP